MTVTASEPPLKSSSVFARVPPNVVRELDLAAGVRGKSRSDVIREALELYVAAMAQARDPQADERPGIEPGRRTAHPRGQVASDAPR